MVLSTAFIPFLLCWPLIASTCMALIAYNMRNMSFSVRCLVGVMTMKVSTDIQYYAYSEWKQILPDSFTLSGTWMIINSTLSLLMANAWAGIFGGSKYYNKHGIDSNTKTIISSLCAGQVYFKSNIHSTYKAMKQILKTVALFLLGYTICKYLDSHPLIVQQIENNVIIHMETLGLLLSIGVVFACIPSNLHYLIFSLLRSDDIVVIPPYDFVYFSSSIREFWKNWSRPAGEMLRYFIYEPLDGRKRWWISVPILFAVNCVIHYQYTLNLYGYTAMYDWNKAFCCMGISICIHILMENMFIFNNKCGKDNIYWRMWSFASFHLSMAITLYILHEKAVPMDIQKFINIFLGRY